MLWFSTPITIRLFLTLTICRLHLVNGICSAKHIVCLLFSMHIFRERSKDEVAAERILPLKQQWLKNAQQRVQKSLQ